MSKMKYINNINFYNLPEGEELEYEKTFNPIMQWREEAKSAYNELKKGSDELYYIAIIINCYINYIHITKGERYAKNHEELKNKNMMEELNIVIKEFNL